MNYNKFSLIFIKIHGKITILVTYCQPKTNKIVLTKQKKVEKSAHIT